MIMKGGGERQKERWESEECWDLNLGYFLFKSAGRFSWRRAQAALAEPIWKHFFFLPTGMCSPATPNIYCQHWGNEYGLNQAMVSQAAPARRRRRRRSQPQECLGCSQRALRGQEVTIWEWGQEKVGIHQSSLGWAWSVLLKRESKTCALLKHSTGQTRLTPPEYWCLYPTCRRKKRWKEIPCRGHNKCEPCVWCSSASSTRNNEMQALGTPVPVPLVPWAPGAREWIPTEGLHLLNPSWSQVFLLTFASPLQKYLLPRHTWPCFALGVWDLEFIPGCITELWEKGWGFQWRYKILQNVWSLHWQAKSKSTSQCLINQTISAPSSFHWVGFVEAEKTELEITPNSPHFVK